MGNDINEISLGGFKVVSGDFFMTPSRSAEPTLTVWNGSIGFCKQDVLLLNSCDSVRVSVNAESKKILITPSASKDKDAIRWIRKTNPLEARRMACTKLTDKLYEAWEWDKDFIYRARGKLVTVNNKVMLLFDFNEIEKWKRPEAKNVK